MWEIIDGGWAEVPLESCLILLYFRKASTEKYSALRTIKLFSKRLLLFLLEFFIAIYFSVYNLLQKKNKIC